MDITTFQCPHCQAVLRMRRKQTSDATFPCPDCQQPLQISQTTEGQLSISLKTAAPAPKTASDFSRKIREWKVSLHRGGTFLLRSPVLMSWIVAGIGAFLILMLILFDQSPTLKNSEEITAAEPPATALETSENPEPAEVETPQPVVPEPDTDPQPEAEPAPQVVSDKPVKADPAENHRELIAVKPEHIPPLVAQKPLPAAPLPVPATDVSVALQIPIMEFRQPEEIPLKKLMRQMEEMLDTEFQVAENIKNDPRLLETPVSFSMKKTTLANLLTKILSKAALTFTVKSNKIYIERAAAP